MLDKYPGVIPIPILHHVIGKKFLKYLIGWDSYQNTIWSQCPHIQFINEFLPQYLRDYAFNVLQDIIML